MITNIHSDRLIIISDLHLGNPFCETRQSLIEFLKVAFDAGYDVCINGDGLEIAQASFHKIASDVPEVFRTLKTLSEHKARVYYVVGNHDIALEHFLEDWGSVKVAPFLNLRSGDARIRIEHGHLYDPFFIKYPDLYEFLTWFAGLLLKVSPSLYKVWIKFENLKSKWRSPQRVPDGIEGEDPAFIEAARMLARRGFDTVIFGHTHHAGVAVMEDQKKYFNSGSWMIRSNFIEVNHGVVSLKTWTGEKLSTPSTLEFISKDVA